MKSSLQAVSKVLIQHCGHGDWDTGRQVGRQAVNVVYRLPAVCSPDEFGRWTQRNLKHIRFLPSPKLGNDKEFSLSLSGMI